MGRQPSSAGSSSHSIASRGIHDDEVDQRLWHSPGIDVEEAWGHLGVVSISLPTVCSGCFVEADAGFAPKEVLFDAEGAEVTEAAADAGCESGEAMAMVVAEDDPVSQAAEAAAGWALLDSDEEDPAVVII